MKRTDKVLSKDDISVLTTALTGYENFEISYLGHDYERVWQVTIDDATKICICYDENLDYTIEFSPRYVCAPCNIKLRPLAFILEAKSRGLIN